VIAAVIAVDAVSAAEDAISLKSFSDKLLPLNVEGAVFFLFFSFFLCQRSKVPQPFLSSKSRSEYFVSTTIPESWFSAHIQRVAGVVAQSLTGFCH
jgi:hypothetical protein